MDRAVAGLERLALYSADRMPGEQKFLVRPQDFWFVAIKAANRTSINFDFSTGFLKFTQNLG